jgi:hypothetical protein
LVVKIPEPEEEDDEDLLLIDMCYGAYSETQKAEKGESFLYQKFNTGKLVRVTEFSRDPNFKQNHAERYADSNYKGVLVILPQSKEVDD